MMTAGQAARSAGVGDMTLRRDVKAGHLRQPPPDLRYSNGRRVFFVDDVLAWKRWRASRPPRAFPPGREAGGRDLGHMLRDEFAELKAATGEAVALAGADATGQVIARFARSGRLTDIPAIDRRAAIRALRQLSVEARPC
jgi:hypothetical protein